jgi:hypothetical protein
LFSPPSFSSLGLSIGDCHSLGQKTPTSKCDPPCYDQGGIGLLGVTMERQRCTHRIGATLASVVPGSRHQVPARREFLWNDYRRVVWLTFAYAHSACARKSNVRTRARSREAMKTDLPVPRVRPPTAARGWGCNFGAPDLQSRGCLDPAGGVHYTTSFDSVRYAGLRGSILCRNAPFNRKCAAATKRTGFARA